MIDIHWDSRYEIGHPRIDHEHQVFVDLIRAVSREALHPVAPERASRLLQEVKKYAEFHFVSEENIMMDADYPDTESHREQHAQLLFQLDERLHRVRLGSLDLQAVAEFMFHWFALHTTQEDKKIADFLATRPAPSSPR
ncbi:bacteriohemerythrin [Roseateles sp.]|uniref:bacteriohemerythrin n=1 Tax=Roseateles sp. TaxID=1971397 RepID=UPI003BA5977B